MNEREARAREILRPYLVGTPIEGDENEIERVMELDIMTRIKVVSIIAGGEADSVDAALEDYRWRCEFYGSVMGDLDNL